MKKDVFILKQEAIFVSLASLAYDIIKGEDKVSFNGEAYSIALSIHRHFNKITTRYSKNRADKLTDYLKNTIGPAFPNVMSPSIMIVCFLHYLLKEGHKETKANFSYLRFKLDFIMEWLESSEHSGKVKTTQETLLTMLGETSSSFKVPQEEKEKSIINLFTCMELLYSYIKEYDDIKINKLFIDFIKEYEEIDKVDYIKEEEIKKYDILKDNILTCKDNIYVIVVLLEKLNIIVNKDIRLLKILKKIKMNFLIKDKERYYEFKSLLNKI